ncbi:MAG: hypothetical protein HWN69_04320 [Desulfobacterales bacterium]|nr:hypothetical protein [Desulfobacterales bacterium]
MQNQLLEHYLEQLKKRCLVDGGFVHRAGGGYRPDATAWAILALKAARISIDELELSMLRLTTDQLEDGRISISSEHPEAFWPTPLAVLAWQGSPAYRKPQSRAVRSLLNKTGVHWLKRSDSAQAHDTSIRGWPWIENTHSWVEPTALSLIALQITGYGGHDRAIEGRRMLLDRQLSQGGWNYGNTITFGKELRPMPDSTGVALNALAGSVSRQDIKHSLQYLKSRVKNIRSPRALGWSILGLGAWGERPSEAPSWILESLRLQEKYGNYDTSPLSLMLISFMAPGGIAGALAK